MFGNVSQSAFLRRSDCFQITVFPKQKHPILDLTISEEAPERNKILFPQVYIKN